MSKVKFIYNAEACKYEPVTNSNRKIILNFLGLLTLSLVMAIGMIYLYQTHFMTIKESNLLTRNQEIKTDFQLLQSKLDQVKSEIEKLQNRDDKVYRTILNLEPIPNTVRIAGIGGTNKYGEFEESLINQEMIMETYRNLDKLKGQMYIQTRSYDELEDVLGVKKEMWASRPAITPMSTADIIRYASGFGWRHHPTLGGVKFHWGIDLTADTGDNIYASGDGVIKKAQYSKSYGFVIYIDHGFGYETRYAHMSRFNVNEGDKVKRGDLIGFIGSTGRSKGPHLHYEVLYKGNKINPVPYLSKNLSSEEFEKLIEDSNSSELILDY